MGGEAGLPIQVHTTITATTPTISTPSAPCLKSSTSSCGTSSSWFPWRGQLDDLLSGEEFEHVFAKIYELSHKVSFQIKTTEAMHYRRYLLAAQLEERKMGHGSGHPVDGQAGRL